MCRQFETIIAVLLLVGLAASAAAEAQAPGPNGAVQRVDGGSHERTPSTLAAREALRDPIQTPDVQLGGPTLDRGALIAAVLERNRDLAAARQALEAVRAGAVEARGLPNLSTTYSFAPASPFLSDTRYGQIIQTSQQLPWPGTLSRRGEQAESLAEAVEGDLEALRRDLALAASQAYDDYQYVQRALAITGEHLDLMRDFQEVATTRYAAGLAPQQAPLAAEVETAHLEHRQVVLTTNQRTVIARLNRLLHRPPHAHVPPPSNGVPVLPEIAAPTRPELIALAVAGRPEVAAARARIAAGETGVELAELKGRPDFQAMTSFNSMWGEVGHRWMVGVGLSLPIWRGRVRAGIARAEAEVSAERERLASLEDRIAAEVSIAVDRLEESRHVIGLYESRLIPAARDQTRASRSGFESGQVDFLAVIDAERRLRDIALGLAEAEAEAQRRLAELKRAVGVPPGDPWPGVLPISRSIRDEGAGPSASRSTR